MHRIASRLLLIATVLLMATASCKRSSKKNMSGEEQVTVEDFVAFFDPLKLPQTYFDSSLTRKLKDSSRIDYKVLTQFIPDSLIPDLGGKKKPALYALGKFENKDAETYLLLHTRGSRNALHLVVLDEDLQAKASLLLMADKGSQSEINKVTFDQKLTITTVDDYSDPDGTWSAYATVYAYNNAGLFTVIMNDGLKKGEVLKFINPIDTLPQLRKHSGDYGSQKTHFLSVRDTDQPGKMQFFMLLNTSAACLSELKSEARWVGADSAIYESGDDDCKIGFSFRGSRVRIYELGGCGRKRPLNCTFDGVLSKKPKPKPKVKPRK